MRGFVRRLSLGWLLLGVAAALAVRPRVDRAPGGEPTYWAADRDAGALIGLDAELFVLERRSWPAPLALESGRAGGLWVACAPRGDPGGGQRLSRLDRAATELDAWDCGRVLDLESAWNGGVFWLEERDARRWIARVDRAGSRRAMPAPPGAVCLMAGSSALMVGTTDGTLWRFDGGWRRGPARGEAVLDLAVAEDGGWWVLVGLGRALALERLGPRLERRARTVLDAAGGTLAVVSPARSSGERECAWVAAEDGRAWRITWEGRCSEELPLYLRGVSSAIRAEGGGVLFALPGALIRKGGGGAPLPGQGGFDYLVDVARVRRPSRTSSE